MSDDKKSYYAIIPASVRYDKRLTANAKLLYGEITALCNEKGYCWASNDYFASLYEVSKQSISHWIKQLCDYGYIKSDLIYRDGTKEIKARYLTLLLGGTVEKYATPTVENFKDNTTSLNTTDNTTDNKKEVKHKYGTYQNVLLTDDEKHRLVKDFHSLADMAIQYLSEYKVEKAYKTQNDNLTIRRWVIEAVRRREGLPDLPNPEKPRAPKTCPKCGARMTGLSCPSCYANFDSEGNEL